MTGHCPYRSPIATLESVTTEGFGVFDREPDAWLCGCPAGEHEDGRDCVDSREQCSIARHYDKTGKPSFGYRKRVGGPRRRLPNLKEVTGKD